MVWQMLGQAAGAGTNWLAADMEQRRQQGLENGRESGRLQDEAWQRIGEQRIEDVLRAASERHRAGQRQLSTALGSDDRLTAGADARARTLADLQGASATVPAMPTRALVDPRGGGDTWAARTTAGMQPMHDARRTQLAEVSAQRGMGRYDTQQLDRNVNEGVDIGRGVAEVQRDQGLMELIRRRMLAQNALRYRDTGPSRTSQNLQLIGSLAGAGGSMADEYTADDGRDGRPTQRPTYDRRPSERPIYNPYAVTPGVSRPLFGPGSYDDQ